MTVTQPVSIELSARPAGRLGDYLTPIHRRWLHDLRAVLDTVETRDADIWPRWNAIRYIDTGFSGQFDRERAAIEKLSHIIGDKKNTRLWVAGELIAMVRWQLCHSVGLCHHAGEFSAITAKLLRAVGHWFSEVEGIVGPVSWTELPIQTRQDLTSLDNENAACWSDLPISLATSL
jgi:hypothetical protein